MAVEPYSISVPDSAIAKLKERLALVEFPDELDDAGWDMGSPLAEVRRLTIVWKDSFSWRKSEKEMNQMPQFRTFIQVDGFDPLNIHFVHEKSPNPRAIPLLFCHGWPGSFLEVRKLLPLLTTSSVQGSPSFHVIAPSLPNYGFSDGVRKRGFGLQQYAETFHKLMQKLGYNEYVTQGGDWAYTMTRAMGLLYPKSCTACHLNVVEGGAGPSLFTHPLLWLQHQSTPYTGHERAGLGRTSQQAAEGQGYDWEQRTKPQTLAYALADSPVALLAWIYEKLHDWADDYPWTDNELLTWVSIYWFSTAGVAANLRTYYEIYGSRADGLLLERVSHYIPVKTGFSQFPKDISVVPDNWAKALGDVVLLTRNEHGGHFAAIEHPEIIARDLNTMFSKGSKAYSCVSGADGY